ncbi:MAG: prepilin peptidase [Acidobacteria bacterium]|nr:prepilin peptidase [Acidobacteriota bacterium]
MNVAIQLVLIAVVLAAAWSDLKTRRIPNWITVPGAVLGVLLQSVYGGVNGAISSLTGAAVGFAVFMVLYITGGMGAGDVKLFAAVGALVGLESLLLVFVFTGLLGGIAAVVLSAYRGRLRQTLRRTGALLIDLGRFRWQEVRNAGVSAGPNALRLPYGAVIAGGTLVSLLVIK